MLKVYPKYYTQTTLKLIQKPILKCQTKNHTKNHTQNHTQMWKFVKELTNYNKQIPPRIISYNNIIISSLKN